MNKDKYSNYTSDDFLEDQLFLNAIKHKRQEDIDYWNAWLATKPSNITAYKAAQLQLKIFLSTERITPEKNFLENLWEDIQNTVQLEKRKNEKILRLRVIWSAAASILMFLGITLWYFTSNITFHTAYGQTKEFSLPDGTQIILNANSELKYPRAYSFKAVRKTYLKGEGYFKVSKGKPFVVYMSNIDVQVLGTEFNIKERRGVTQVTLIRGRVQIYQNNPNIQQKTVLRPLELFTYNERINKAEKKIVSPVSYVAWMEKRAIADNTRIGDVIADYEDTYGQKIVLEDPALYERVIDGIIPMGSKENTLFVIASILNLRVENKGDTILLKSYKPINQ